MDEVLTGTGRVEDEAGGVFDLEESNTESKSQNGRSSINHTAVTVRFPAAFKQSPDEFLLSVSPSYVGVPVVLVMDDGRRSPCTIVSGDGQLSGRGRIGISGAFSFPSTRLGRLARWRGVRIYFLRFSKRLCPVPEPISPLIFPGSLFVCEGPEV